MRPRIAITMGDVNGVGPEVLAKALAIPAIWEVCEPLIIGSAEVLESARGFAAECPRTRTVGSTDDPPGDRIVLVDDAGMPTPGILPGHVGEESGRCAVEWVKHAVRLARRGAVAAVVTCPINKKGIHLAGYGYAGHTEILMELTGTREVRMSLFSERMRVVHVSAHCPLAESIRYVKAERIDQTIRIAHDALTRLGLTRKRIAVAGLNPHAGETGILGTEESAEIEPAIAACKQDGIDCSGPYPPDTVFLRMLKGESDLVIAMYHDQGHTPFKLVAMDEGVQATLGLPIVRSSVDHGTAYDIAWKGVASANSLCAAIRFAVRFAASAVPNVRDSQ